ncbi:MAG: hypothetical protein LBD71_00530 [Treponema sp.]|nr:hypothetical protein [Treponema sp.]
MEFDSFFKNYCQYVNARCTGANPEWTHIPTPRRTDLNTACEDWYTCYSRLKTAHTSSDVLAKNLARARDEKVLRNFNNEFILYSFVAAPQEKEDLGNHIRDEHPTPVPAPTAQAEADIVLPGPHLVEPRIRRLASLEPDPDRANYGIRIYWGVLGEPDAADKFRIQTPPLTGEDLPHSTFTHRKKFRFDFPEEDRGRTVYFCLQYENAKGGEQGKGLWGPVFSAIIP